ncbi:MAG: Coenzyme F420 hydrogenase/dehydrogenase, beta subunit C-terminal domain [Deltaproteobacteria bacterium]|nr:Coenzyme F420 hydrogenase/dehydrogenase, beta subunit C-terminal domain [Deltaproteobacteria bacterium]
MVNSLKLETKDTDLLGALQNFFKSLLGIDEIQAILVPQILPMKNMVMPVLISDPERLDGVDPLSPAFPMNGAKIVSKLTRKPIGGKVAVVLRPCEIRAFIELVKLKQGHMDEIIIIGIDCLGAYKNTDYFQYVGEDPKESTQRFYESVLSGNGASLENVELAPACKACEHPVPEHADILIGLFGLDIHKHILIQTQTEKGKKITDNLELPKMGEPPERKTAIENLIAERIDYRDKMFAETSAATDTLEKLTAYLANCINCYNCRVACPVCYCRECVFVTDVFNHEPSQYLRWSARKGAIKMPTDTVFYHLTRLAHMSTACVGCGQCSNACPNGIHVMELFRTVADRTQKGFNYEAGRSLEEFPPMSEFREDEFDEVVGIS